MTRRIHSIAVLAALLSSPTLLHAQDRDAAVDAEPPRDASVEDPDAWVQAGCVPFEAAFGSLEAPSSVDFNLEGAPDVPAGTPLRVVALFADPALPEVPLAPNMFSLRLLGGQWAPFDELGTSRPGGPCDPDAGDCATEPQRFVAGSVQPPNPWPDTVQLEFAQTDGAPQAFWQICLAVPTAVAVPIEDRDVGGADAGDSPWDYADGGVWDPAPDGGEYAGDAGAGAGTETPSGNDEAPADAEKSSSCQTVGGRPGPFGLVSGLVLLALRIRRRARG